MEESDNKITYLNKTFSTGSASASDAGGAAAPRCSTVGGGRGEKKPQNSSVNKREEREALRQIRRTSFPRVRSREKCSPPQQMSPCNLI